MSNKNKNSSEIVVLQQIPSHQGLITTNRWLLRGVFFLMSVIVIAGFLVLPKANFLAHYQQVTANDSVLADSAEINHLKGQLVGLLSGSIESKLQTLEQSIRSGTVTHALGTLADLKNDVKALQTYSKPQPVAAVANEQVIQEVSQLKRLIYLSFASCGLMFAALAGIWVKSLDKLPFQQAVIRYLSKH